MPLKALEEKKEAFQHKLAQYNCKGTIILSPEGVNTTLAFPKLYKKPILQLFMEHFESLDYKQNFCTENPFRRLFIKIKPEIITFRESPLSAGKSPASYISPETLKQWYDERKDMVVMDIRNDFELEFGAFKNSLNLELENFTNFKKAAKQLPGKYKDKTIVTYCTGGIRCEKAAPYLKNLGFKDVYQLNGGILKYFEKCGNQHYQGECFVFDGRVSVGKNLQETTTSFCNACQIPIHNPRVKKEFSIRERYCPDCADAVPPYLKNKWENFYEKTNQVLESKKSM